MQTQIISSNKLLEGTNLSILDTARLVRNLLDFKADDSKLTDIQHCQKIIELGIKAYREQSIGKTLIKGFEQYLASKSDLSKDALKDIKYLGARLFRTCPQMKMVKFSNLTSSRCLEWLEKSFDTNVQFNKGRTFLSGLFSYAIKQNWLKENLISSIEIKHVEETEIKALSIPQIKRLLKTAKLPAHKACAAALGIMLWAGVRPKEVSRLKWKDIDLDERIITIRSSTSKTGGTRHIEITTVLRKWLQKLKKPPTENICPTDWIRRWKALRDDAGFKGEWINDVLRHTFASYHLKQFKNLILLQAEMGHRDLNLLRSRYVNMQGISKDDAWTFFNFYKIKFSNT